MLATARLWHLVICGRASRLKICDVMDLYEARNENDVSGATCSAVKTVL